MPSKKGKKHRRSRDGGVVEGGVGNSVGDDGGGTSGALLLADVVCPMDVEVAEVQRVAEAYVPRVVDFVYTEKGLRKSEGVPYGDTQIEQEWLQGCVKRSLQDWQDRLPGVVLSDVVRTLIPATAHTYDDLVGDQKAIVTIELADWGSSKSLASQIASSNASTMECKEREAKLVEVLRDYHLLFESSVATSVEKSKNELREDFRQLTRELEASKRRHEEFERRLEESERRHEECELRIRGLTEDVVNVRGIAKKAILLSNKVKKRVALARARDAVVMTLGLQKEATDTWSSYIGRLTDDDWDKVCVTESRVKRLLAHGSYAFNEAIHEASAADVVDSVASMSDGPERSAWEVIFFLAFGEHVTDDQFWVEIEFASQITALQL